MTNRKRKLAVPPWPPREPRPEECCGQGCTPCVYDVYERDLGKYRAALEAWRARKKRSR
ncbi:MAG: oxidoreductase-like domain-containing protein [Terriglobales bacterium]